MIAKELLTDEILPLKTSDTCAFALGVMEENRVHHLPVVNERELLGLISEFDISNHHKPGDPIGDVQLSLLNAFCNEYQHIFDVFKMFTEMKLSLLPVVDAKSNYMGIITLSKLVGAYSGHSSILDPGGIIILEMTENNYSLVEISNIVESNDARIMNMFITTYPDSTQIDVTIKINKIDIAAIIQTLSRYNYTIKATFTEKDNLDDLKERYDALMNYLNV